jgi:hypothetical protein
VSPPPANGEQSLQVPVSTRTGIDRSEGRSAVWGRRVVMGALVVLVLAGLTGYLGVHTTSATAEGDGYRLTLRYASVARAGLDVPWQVTVTSASGFGDTVTLAVTGDYFDIYETQGFLPDPDKAVRNGDTLYLTFAAPAGDTFVVSYDAYIQPSSQIGRDGTVGVLTSDGRTVAALDFRTRLLP